MHAVEVRNGRMRKAAEHTARELAAFARQRSSGFAADLDRPPVHANAPLTSRADPIDRRI
jgi:hypothetical protein